MSRTIEQMEAFVAEALTGYLATPRSDSEFPLQLCSAAAAWIDQLLKGDERWPPGWWVDDIDMCAIQPESPRSVHLSGLAVTGDDLRHQWIEPVQMRITLASSGSELAGYEAFLGDATTGLATVVVGQRRPKTWPDVAEWVFAFHHAEIHS